MRDTVVFMAQKHCSFPSNIILQAFSECLEKGSTLYQYIT